ncbi:MAG: FAD-dependent oxidoreductase [Actinomycetales bacterium]
MSSRRAPLLGKSPIRADRSVASPTASGDTRNAPSLPRPRWAGLVRNRGLLPRRRAARDPEAPQAREYDVIVAGSGAAGLAAAVTAAYHGCRVLVVERADRCGGASARSGGWIWAPGNPLARAAGVREHRDEHRAYLQAVIEDDYDDERIETFLETAPHMVGFFHRRTPLRFTLGDRINDIYADLPGAGTGHRSVAAAPFYGTALPKSLRAKLAHQFYMTSFLGMGIMAGPDLTRFLTALHSPRSFLHATRRCLTHTFDLLVFRRNMQFVNGVALVARLMQAAQDLGVEILTGTEVVELTSCVDASANLQKVDGVVIDVAGQRTRIAARRGVVVATGGFPANPELRARTFARTPTGHEHWTLAPDTCDGAGLRLVEPLGGRLDSSGRSAAAWCPVSLVRFPWGHQGVFPHIADRAKPGVIGVLADGRRFVNEANGYYDYVDAMMRSVPPGEPVESWLICDHHALRTYMLGFAKPRPMPVWPYRAIGYLTVGRTLGELAERCGIDGPGLRATVERFNAQAVLGLDPDFARGSTPFNRYGGDPEVTPNPSLAPLGNGPYYAVKVLPGSFGTFAGIATDATGRVLGGAGLPIEGLFTAGNDMASIMAGRYPAGGINLGPAMTFGYLVGRQLAAATQTYEDDGTSSPGSEYAGQALHHLAATARPSASERDDEAGSLR